MAVKDLVSQVTQSRLGKAISGVVNRLDRDKEQQGFQFTSPQLRQNLRQVGQGFAQEQQRSQSSPFVKYNPVTQLGNELARDIYGSTQALKERQRLINERTQGMSLLDRIKSTQTSKERELLTTGIQKGAESVGTIMAPRFVPQAVIGGGLSYAGSKLTGASEQEARRSAINAAQLGPVFGKVAQATNPIISSQLTRLPVTGAITSRVAPAVANVAQGIAMDVATGQRTTPLSVGVDVAAGLIGGQGQFGGVKGFDVGRSSRNRWTPEDTNLFDGINDYLRKNYKKLSDQEVDQLDTELSRLANGYLPNETITRITTKHGSNTKGVLRELSDELQKSIKSQESGLGAVKMGITGDTSKQIKSYQVGKEGLQIKTKSYDDIISGARNEIGTTTDKAPRSVKKIADDFYTQWVNRFAPVERASEFVKKQLKTKGASLRPENDPEYLVRRFTGAGGIASERFKNVLKPIVDEMDALKIDKLDMDAYLKAKRDLGLAERNIIGSDSNLASQRITALMGKYPRIDEIAQKLYKYQNDGFQEMIDAGFLSKEAGNIIRQQNPNYVPFQRVMDELDNYLGVPSNKLQQGTSPIQKIKGSKRQIESPIESVIANTFKQRAAIEKNRVAQSIVDLQKIAPELGFEKMKKSTPDTITIWRDGKKEYWKVGTDIAETVKAVNEESMNTLLKIFQAPASLLRQGATGRNPDFLIPNIIKDQFDASISSKYGYIPFVDYVSGLKSMINNDELYQRWANSGAKIDLGELSGRKSIKESFDQATKRKGLLGWLGTGLDKLGTISEVPTRVGLFKKAYKKTGNELIAAMESRDATVDFARMGSKMKVANSVIPFLNVGVQGFDKIIRQAKDNPAKLALKAGIYAAIPAISTTLYNLTSHPQEYSEIPQYVKDSNFVLVSGRNEDGTVDYFTITKGNIAPLITNPIENFLAYTAGQNEQTLSEFATQFITSALPVVGDGSSLKEVATKTIGQNLPQLIKPPIEGLLNRSFYKYDPKKEQSKEIVPSYLKSREPYQQAYEWTPSAYKKIGAVLNVSPLSVQHYLESYLAGYTKVPSQIVGILNNVSQGKEVRKNDIPILRRFMSTTFPSSGVKPVDKGEQQTTPFLERITGKVSAKEIGSDKVITQQLRDNIKERVKYGNKVSDSELTAAYLGTTLSMPKSGRYEKSQRDSKLYSSLSDVENNEYLTPDQKDTIKTKIASELGIERNDLDIYKVAKEDNNTKTRYLLDQRDVQSNEDFVRTLVRGRKPVNNQILVSDGVIDNLVRDGVIPEALGKDLKKIDLDQTGKLKVSKKKGTKAKVTKAKVTPNYIKLKSLKPFGGTSRIVVPKINTRSLTFSEGK